MNNEEFNTLEDYSTSEVIEKKSRFIADAYHIENKEQAEEIINKTRKKYYDAKHVCFAYSFLDEKNNSIEKASDDGEPSGTAGMPILNVIKKNNLNNIIILVTRYFGGILLGTGGLTRVYSLSAKNAVENAIIVKQEAGYLVEIKIEYSENEKFKYYIDKNKINIEDIQYGETILYKIEINEEDYQKIILPNNDNLMFKIISNRVICRKTIKKAK